MGVEILMVKRHRTLRLTHDKRGSIVRMRAIVRNRIRFRSLSLNAWERSFDQPHAFFYCYDLIAFQLRQFCHRSAGPGDLD